MVIKLIKPENYRSVPWKNGRGVTKELAVSYGGDKERYIWRLSIAGVTEDGPFSDFKGYDRTLIMLQGNGIDLIHSDGTGTKIENIYDIAHFSGDLITEGKLTSGQIKDFNVISLREACLTETQILKAGQRSCVKGDEICFYAVTGTEFIIEELSYLIPEDHLMILESASGVLDISVNYGLIIAVTVSYIGTWKLS